MAVGTAGAGAAGSGRAKGERRSAASLGRPLLGMLVIQGILGFALNAFVSLPMKPNGLSVLASQPLLDLHLVLGVLLLGILSRILLLARLEQNRRALGAAAVSMLLVLVAIGGGLAFVFGGGSDAASIAMALAWVGAMVLGLVIAVSRDPRPGLAPGAAAS